jgi:uncharacterized integral membrane protein
LVFIPQNRQRVRLRFLIVHGTLPLGVALRFAALLVAGAARVLQLRVVARRHRRAHQPPGRDHSQQSGCRPGWLATR